MLRAPIFGEKKLHKQLLSLVSLVSLVGLVGLVLASSLRKPSCPPGFEGRETPHDFDWQSLGRTDLSGAAWSVATSFVGLGDYFSGPHSRVFYLGRGSELHGKFLIYYPGGRSARHELRFYLDYRPIAVRVRTSPDGEWRETAVVEHDGVADGRNVFELVVTAIPSGRHDLAIVTRHADASRPSSIVDGKPQEVPLLDQDIHVVQIVRERDVLGPVIVTPPVRASHVKCKDRERYLFAKGADVAVVNCKLTPARGVLFGAGSGALVYELAPESSGVFRFGELPRVSHVGEAFVPFEDPSGVLQDNHRDLVGL